MQACCSSTGTHSFKEGKESVLRISRNIVRTVTYSQVQKTSTSIGIGYQGATLGLDHEKFKENTKRLEESIPQGLDNSLEFRFTERWCEWCGQAIPVLDKLLFGLLGLGLDQQRVCDFLNETDNFQRFLTY